MDCIAVAKGGSKHPGIDASYHRAPSLLKGERVFDVKEGREQ
jgi:hypothetical protein